MREKNWDKYEVALLIEAFLTIEDGADKILTLENLSAKLRKMALIDGFDVDDRFRNLNGMQWQLGYIKLILNGVEAYFVDEEMNVDKLWVTNSNIEANSINVGTINCNVKTKEDFTNKLA